jgi:hypothetical protein
MRSGRVAAILLMAALSAACVAPALPSPDAHVAVAVSPSPPTRSTGSTTLIASPRPPGSAGQPEDSGPPTANPTDSPDASTLQPPSAEPSLPPPPGRPRLAGVTSRWQGGCGALYLGTTIISEDDCGPLPFDGLIRSTPLRVLSGARLVLRAADGVAFSVVTAGLAGEWSVSIARASELAGRDDGQSGGFPSGIGTTLAHGRGPDTTIVITMPDRDGDYVVQFNGPLVRDRWTFAEGVYFWLVRVV